MRNQKLARGNRVRVASYAERHGGRIAYIKTLYNSNSNKEMAILMEDSKTEVCDIFSVPVHDLIKDCGAFFCGHPAHRCRC